MHKVIIGSKVLFAKDGELLSDCLINAGIAVSHPCGMKGICKKCLVYVNGKAELSCRYKIQSDIEVKIPQTEKNETSASSTDCSAKNTALVLDLGTTTLAMALVDLDKKEVIKTITKTNPQKAFGADVISRIDYCIKHSVDKLHSVLKTTLNEMIDTLAPNGAKTLYAAGNTVMLHILFNVDCSSIGTAPYTPIFLDSKTADGKTLGLDKIKKVVSLANISSFVGADIVAGLNCIPSPEKGKYSLLIDLGTNAETVLYSGNSILCTAAAAGPCFEGANIECGTNARPGAISAFKLKGKIKEITTIDNMPPTGICATGLIDIMAELLKNNIIDGTGYMQEEKYYIDNSVYISQADIRQFQLAKSAVNSAVVTLMKLENISFADIDTVFISGGFSSQINISNAVLTGLIPKELENKCVSIENSSLKGAVKYAFENNDLTKFTKIAKYIDLSSNAVFSKLFIDNMIFYGE